MVYMHFLWEHYNIFTELIKILFVKYNHLQHKTIDVTPDFWIHFISFDLYMDLVKGKKLESLRTNAQCRNFLINFNPCSNMESICYLLWFASSKHQKGGCYWK